MKKLLNTFTDNIQKALRLGSGVSQPLPRKGLFAFTNQVINKKQQRQFVLNSATLYKLANTDPIMWSIRRVIKGYISQTKWDIVPDTMDVETEFDRWEELAIDSINPYGFDSDLEFKSEILSKDLYEEVKYKLDIILDDLTSPDAAKRDRVRWMFRTMARRVKQEAEAHKHTVKKIFDHPNNTETSFRALLELLIDDILVFDAGTLVKNYNYNNRLAELYTLPGQEIKIYRNEDGTMPVSPEPAYAWEDKGILRAEFVNDELVYMMQNPQHSGYGMSGIEVASYIITASLYADEYNIDFFKHSNVPPGIVNLGENVTDEQRQMFQSLWEQELHGRGGLHKLVFTAGSDKIQFVPMNVMTNRDMQMMEYLKWAASVKCACYGLSPQDIGFVLDFHRSTSETQETLSQKRGIKSLLNLLESYLNGEVVKSEFEFTDVKFKFLTDDNKDNIQQAQVDNLDIKSGVININERRKSRGMKPIEGGDEYIVATPGGMPVSEYAKLDDLKLDQPGMMPGDSPVLNPDSSGMGVTTQTPGPAPQQQVDGDPGRPIENAQKGNELTVKVNKNKPIKEQHEMLDKTVDALKQQGIKAILKIGFSDSNEDGNDSKR